MRMDCSSQATAKKKLSALSLLKEALLIHCKTINFILLNFLASLPFLCLSAFLESYLQRTMVGASKIVTAPSNYYYHRRDPVARIVTGELSELFSSKVIALGLLYMVPLHLLEFCSSLCTVTLASKLYSAGNPLTLGEIIRIQIGVARLKCGFITFVVARFFSICFLAGFLWLALNNYAIFRHTIYDVYFTAVVGGAILVALVKYMEGVAEWSMAMVISIVEEDMHGVEPFALSAHFSRGNERRGCLLVLIFFAWGAVLRLSRFFVGSYTEGEETIMQLVLIFVGNTMKWSAFVVYFNDCKKHALDLLVDEDVQMLVQAEDGQKGPRISGFASSSAVNSGSVSFNLICENKFTNSVVQITEFITPANASFDH